MEIRGTHMVILLAPFQMKRIGFGLVLLGDGLKGPAALIGILKTVGQIALGLQLRARKRFELFGKVDIIPRILAGFVHIALRQGFLELFLHALRDRAHQKGHAQALGILFQQGHSLGQISLPDGGQPCIAAVHAALHTQQAIVLPKGNLGVIVAAPDKNIRKAVFTQAVIFQCGQTIHHGLIGKSKFAESQHKSSILLFCLIWSLLFCAKNLFSVPPAGTFTVRCPPWHRECDAPRGAFRRTAPWAAPGHFFAAGARAPPTASA